MTTTTVWPANNPDSDLFANSADLAFLLDNKAGTYVMRYIDEARWGILRRHFRPVRERHVRWPPVGLFIGERH